LSRQSKAKVQALESRLAIAHAKLEDSSKKKVSALEKASEMASLNVVKTNQRLREENADLRDDVEELRAMIDVLKARGSPGLVREPSTSPVNPPVFSR
jgi:predicted HTH domain antitoxin